MNRWLKGCLIGCGAIVVIGIVVVAVGFNWLRQVIEAPPPPMPSIGKFVALRPRFVFRNGETLDAGTAAVLRPRTSGRPMVVVTALHLLGPDGGLPAPADPAAINALVREVQLFPMSGGKPVARARKSLLKSGRPLSEDGGAGRDLLAFQLEPRATINALPLAETDARPLQWVWVVGDRADAQAPAQRLWAARVIAVDETAGVLRFRGVVPLRAFSGAPIINEEIKVVGLLLGGDERQGIGIFNPAGAMRAHLGEAGPQ